MFKTILVCLDGSEQDKVVTQAALWFGEHLKATLHGLHVLDLIALESPMLYDLSGSLALIPQMNFMEENRKILTQKGETLLDIFKSKCQEKSIPCQVFLETGVVHKTITDKAQTHDLTLLGRRGLNYKLDRDLMGSTADRVVRKTQSPLLVLTHEFTPLRSPLLAYDGSAAAREAMQSCVRLVTELKLPLTVLNVNSDPEQSKEILQEAKAYLDAHPMVVKYDSIKGTAHKDIPEYVKQHGHDLVVLGAHGHLGIVELLLGTTTEYLLWQGAAHVFVDR